MTYRYAFTLLPGIAGLIVGAMVTSVWHGDSVAATAYVALPEFHLWRIVMIIQFSVYTMVIAYLWIGSIETSLPRLPARDGLAVGMLIVLVIVLPSLLGDDFKLPLVAHRCRLFAVIAIGLVAMLLLANRLASIHRAFGEATTVERHVALRKAAEELLTIAAVVVTLATLGSAVLQNSLDALDATLGADYYSRLQVQHVVAYGAYFTLILFLFFAPILVADRASAVRIRTVLVDRDLPDEDKLRAQLGLDASLREKIASTFGVLSPLLGALLPQLVR